MPMAFVKETSTKQAKSECCLNAAARVVFALDSFNLLRRPRQSTRPLLSFPQLLVILLPPSAPSPHAIASRYIRLILIRAHHSNSDAAQERCALRRYVRLQFTDG